MTQPSRSQLLTRASNFRDLGGYVGADGRTLKWRQLFRSDHLAGLPPEDLQKLAGMGVRYAVDFRSDAERQAHSYDIEAVENLHLPIEPQVLHRKREWMAQGKTLTPQITHQLMEDTYAAIVRNNQPQLGAFFKLLLQRPGPVVFHCTAGKDRTGLAAALLLAALGVHRDDVMQDYLLTNNLYRRPDFASYGIELPGEVLDVLWRVHPAFLQRAFDVIGQEFGGTARYLENRLGVGAAQRSQLQAFYLE